MLLRILDAQTSYLPKMSIRLQGIIRILPLPLSHCLTSDKLHNSSSRKIKQTRQVKCSHSHWRIINTQ